MSCLARISKCAITFWLQTSSFFLFSSLTVEWCNKERSQKHFQWPNCRESSQNGDITTEFSQTVELFCLLKLGLLKIKLTSNKRAVQWVFHGIDLVHMSFNHRCFLFPFHKCGLVFFSLRVCVNALTGQLLFTVWTITRRICDDCLLTARRLGQTHLLRTYACNGSPELQEISCRRQSRPSVCRPILLLRQRNVMSGLN